MWVDRGTIRRGALLLGMAAGLASAPALAGGVDFRIREGGRTIGAGQVTEILERAAGGAGAIGAGPPASDARAAVREGGRTIGAGQVTEILERATVREGGRTIGAGQVTEILE